MQYGAETRFPLESTEFKSSASLPGSTLISQVGCDYYINGGIGALYKGLNISVGPVLLDSIDLFRVWSYPVGDCLP